MPIFSPREIERRQDEIRHRLRDSDAAVVFSFYNSYYLSGVPIVPWGRPSITIVPREGPPAMILPEIEKERACEHSPISEMHTYSDSDGPSEEASIRLLEGFLRSRGLRRVALDTTGTSIATAEMLQAAMPDIELSDVSPELDDMKLISSDEELVLIRTATDIAQVGVDAFIDACTIGAPEIVLAGNAMLAMTEYAAQHHENTETRVNCYSQQGVRSLQPHTGSSGDAIRDGELIALVIEVYAWNYQVAVERAILAGTPSDEQLHYYRTMTEAQDRAIQSIRPGTAFGDVDLAAREVFDSEGYDEPHCGTGLIRGLMTEWEGRIDGGNLRVYNENLLRPGMVLSVEPWAAVPGVGAARHSDVVLVTEQGHALLTKRAAGIIRVS